MSVPLSHQLIWSVFIHTNSAVVTTVRQLSDYCNFIVKYNFDMHTGLIFFGESVHVKLCVFVQCECV